MPNGGKCKELTLAVLKVLGVLHGTGFGAAAVSVDDVVANLEPLGTVQRVGEQDESFRKRVTSF
jgi:hypothetical protein